MSLSEVRTYARRRLGKEIAVEAADAVEWAIDLLVAAKKVSAERAETMRAKKGFHFPHINVYFPDVLHHQVLEVDAGPFAIGRDGKPVRMWARPAGHTRYDYARVRAMATTRYDAQDREYRLTHRIPVYIYMRDQRSGGDAHAVLRTIVHELFHAFDFVEYVAARYEIESLYNLTDRAVDRLRAAERNAHNRDRVEMRAEVATSAATHVVTHEMAERRIGRLAAAILQSHAP